MKKLVHAVAAFIFILSMVHWIQLLTELHAVEAWTDYEMTRYATGFLWQFTVIICTVPSILVLGSGIFSRVLPSSTPPKIQQPVVDEWSAVTVVVALYLGMALLAHPSSVFGYYLVAMLSMLLPLAVIEFICRLNYQTSWAPGFNLSMTWLGFFLAVVTIVTISILSNFLSRLLPVLHSSMIQQVYEWIAGATLTHYPFHLIWAFLAGITEELIFRGFLLSQIFRRTQSVSIALLATSFLFGLIHFSYGWYYVLILSVYGLCFGVVALWRRNLFPAILAHVWLNLFVLSAIGTRMAGYPGL